MQDHLPNDGAIADWPFAQTIREWSVAEDQHNPAAGSNEFVKLGHAVTGWRDLRNMAAIKCTVCNGFGHTWKQCPSNKKLTNVGRASVTMRNRVSRARHYHNVTRARHVRERNHLADYSGVGSRRGCRPGRTFQYVRRSQANTAANSVAGD